LTQRENQRDNDKDRYVLAAQSRQVAGAAERKARARSPSRKTAYPPAFSQQRPLSRINRPYGQHQTEPRAAFSCREKQERGHSALAATVRPSQKVELEQIEAPCAVADLSICLAIDGEEGGLIVRDLVNKFEVCRKRNHVEHVVLRVIGVEVNLNRLGVG
jgi:hypothetical protein